MLKGMVSVFVALGVFASQGTAAHASSAPRAEIGITAITTWLKAHGPRYVVFFDDIKGAGADNLVRAGIIERLRRANQWNCGETAGRLTTLGQGVAARLGWLVTDYSLAIPLGRFNYVDGSLEMVKGSHPGRAWIRITFKGNANVAYLRTLGQASDWPIEMLDGRTISIGNEGEMLWAQLPVELIGFRWAILSSDPPRLRPNC